MVDVVEKLEYDNIFESIFPDDLEKAKDLEELSRLCVKHNVIPFFKGEERYKAMVLAYNEKMGYEV